jgi:threonine aldolase
MNPIDLRSDTVTRPTAAMRAAMAAAEVGDDVWGDDPTVNALQERVAGLLGKETALFVTSGTQGNLSAIMAHCQRGDEVLVGDQAHCYLHEAGGVAVLGGIQPQVLRQRADGTIDLQEIAGAIKPDDPHSARTRALALENTWGGRVLPPDYVQAATALAHSCGLATHLDGARLFNAGTALAERHGGTVWTQVRTLADRFDSVTFCFSKGLGAPVGSIVAGSREFIGRVLRVRKMLGGALRQVGVLAAAASHALDRHVERLAEDHANARRLAEGLQGLAGVEVEPPQTNIVWVTLAGGPVAGLVERLAAAGVLCSGERTLRLVTHLDVSARDVERAIPILRQQLPSNA